MGTTSSKPTVSMPGTFPSEVDERQANGAEQEFQNQSITSEAGNADWNNDHPHDTSSTTPPLCNTPTASVESPDQAQQDNDTHDGILQDLWAARTLYRYSSKDFQHKSGAFMLGYYGLEKCCNAKARYREYFGLVPEHNPLTEVYEAVRSEERCRARSYVRMAEAGLREVDENRARDLRRVIRSCFVPSRAHRHPRTEVAELESYYG
ncbi:hypothetical protein LTR37_015756 [Vermiconidia calcicola]|uniref:Uncharacterized protein n=1 Tax=Vermiconidia calcicola TaxID=1690605 RepID=A0ACC3MPX0_9PEZI|nr:hypothetical protein LTR37_015756 [Vermiconidia calcicola]